VGSKLPTRPPANSSNRIGPLPPAPPPAKARRPILDRTIIKPGTPVTLGPECEIQATLLEASVKGDCYVQYRVAWWDGNERKTEWVEEAEVFSCDSTAKSAIGFVGN
jgi:hypothetical protein